MIFDAKELVQWGIKSGLITANKEPQLSACTIKKRINEACRTGNTNSKYYVKPSELPKKNRYYIAPGLDSYKDFAT
jgi:hypothetical protein